MHRTKKEIRHIQLEKTKIILKKKKKNRDEKNRLFN